MRVAKVPVSMSEKLFPKIRSARFKEGILMVRLKNVVSAMVKETPGFFQSKRNGIFNGFSHA
jgi:hypothetical protein